ncbi:MAG TPA: hypothetical protein PLY96_13925 [Chromatiaceae bacterium]|nr:hypothetical protein [Chromatiaceae bacterium]
MRPLNFSTTSLAVALALVGLLQQPVALASRWEVRQEAREGAREVAREKREARRELRRCETRACARREIKEGYREVQREKREARREIRREVREDRWRDDRDDGSDVMTGVVIGAAVVGIAAAIANSQDD